MQLSGATLSKRKHCNLKRAKIEQLADLELFIIDCALQHNKRSSVVNTAVRTNSHPAKYRHIIIATWYHMKFHFFIAHVTLT